MTERFVEANLLFVLDQLIKGAIGAITGLLGGIAAILPIPGLQGVVSFINTVIRLSLTYVDEIILGYNIRLGSQNPFETARQGVVLYAQNGTTMLKNAVWLALIMWALTIVVFLFMLAPAAAILYYMPGALAGWSFVLAIILAWAVKAALLEPFAIAALMQVYFKVIAGQTPNPDWDRRLADASKQFRELKDKALASFGGLAAGDSRGRSRPLETAPQPVPKHGGAGKRRLALRSAAPISGYDDAALHPSRSISSISRHRAILSAPTG